MSIADDLIAVRTLLILRGRAVGKWEDEQGRICLGHAIEEVAYKDAKLKIAMSDALIEYLPLDMAEPTRQLKKHPHVSLLRRADRYLVLIALYNDRTPDDQDIYHLIEKALAELGAMV